MQSSNNPNETLHILNTQHYKNNKLIPSEDIESQPTILQDQTQRELPESQQVTDIESQNSNSAENKSETDQINCKEEEMVIQPQSHQPNRDYQVVERIVDDQFDEELRRLIKFRYCFKCKSVKPPRAHHCSICNACVMRMDHHCPWVGNCIGIKNHKFFWNFLLYAFLGTSQIAIALFSNHDAMQKITLDLFYMIATIISLSFAIAISFLLVIHTFMIVFNLLTIEMGSLLNQNPFKQRNWRDNVAQTMGQNWKTWFLPIDPEDRACDGVNYQITSSYY